MNPYLTGAGRAVLVSAILFIVMGTLSGIWVLVALGALQAFMLAMAYYALLPATLALERRLLSVDIAPLDHARVGTLRTGKPLTLDFKVSNRSGTRLRGIRLSMYGGSALSVTEAIPGPIELPAYSAVEGDFSLVSHATGRWMIHGFQVVVEDFLGLVAVGEYIPSMTALKFVPDLQLPRRGMGKAVRARRQDLEGAHMVRVRGSGMELRELRQHQHGDSFRSIAWKATARTGRLMVREHESEFVLNYYLCMDISSTVRGGGAPGKISRMEHLLRLVMGSAEYIVSSGNRAGLITFDEKVYGHLKPKETRAHLGRILQHLTGVRHVMDEDLTEFSDQEIAEVLARYLMVQERLDFRKKLVHNKVKGVGQGMDYWSFSRDLIEVDQTIYDMEMLEQWVEASLDDEEDLWDDPCLHAGVPNYSELSSLRRFCHLRGIEVPYKVESRLGQKERGLVQCLEEVAQQARDAHTVLVFSDLSSIANTEPLLRSLRWLQSRRHRVVFVAPFTPAYSGVEKGKSARSEALHGLLTLAESDERAQTIKAIKSVGAPVISVGPEDSLAHVFQGLRRRR